MKRCVMSSEGLPSLIVLLYLQRNCEIIHLLFECSEVRIVVVCLSVNHKSMITITLLEHFNLEHFGYGAIAEV